MLTSQLLLQQLDPMSAAQSSHPLRRTRRAVGLYPASERGPIAEQNSVIIAEGERRNVMDSLFVSLA